MNISKNPFRKLPLTYIITGRCLHWDIHRRSTGYLLHMRLFVGAHLIEELFQVLAAAQAERFEEVHEVEEGELSGMCDGAGLVPAATSQGHSPPPRPVAAGEAEGEAPRAEP